MRTSSLPDGSVIPALGLGTWKSRKGEVAGAITAAIDIGYRHIDCAAIYGNEREIGDALREAVAAGRVARDELWITSKLWNDAHGAEHVEPALRRTLDDLQLDALDLYLVHWPVALRPGVIVPEKPEDFRSLEDVPLTETWGAMEACQRKGLCRHIGVSNFSAAKLRSLLATATVRPVMNQVEAHPLLQQNDLVELCRREGVLVTAYSPLSLLEHPAIGAIAERRGLSSAQVLIAWAINRGTVCIPKSVDPGRLRQNFEAADVELDEQEMASIAALDRHFRYVTGAFWEMKGAPYTVAALWDE
jgi:alcohol dehydrogenase (NADP+)